MRELLMFRLGELSVAELEGLQAELLSEQDSWLKKRKRATGQVVSKGVGRRSGMSRVRAMPGRRDAALLRQADAELVTLRRHLGSVEKELARRAAGEAAARA